MTYAELVEYVATAVCHAETGSTSPCVPCRRTARIVLDALRDRDGVVAFGKGKVWENFVTTPAFASWPEESEPTRG